MKLSISNIAWEQKWDTQVYSLMKKYGFTGLEIAPIRIFPEAPYDKLKSAFEWNDTLKEQYGLQVSSMQSIWYGRQEKIFGSSQERDTLLAYTKKAIDFAQVIACKNLVFGCPRNRVLPDGEDKNKAISFFKELGDYAVEKGTVIGMEANPPVYHTNYINTTQDALELMERVASKGFLLNLDLGTMIENKEQIEVLEGKTGWINHVHISEPGLRKIEHRSFHGEMAAFLKESGYQGYVSIEMQRQEVLSEVEETMDYVREIFL